MSSSPFSSSFSSGLPPGFLTIAALMFSTLRFQNGWHTCGFLDSGLVSTLIAVTISSQSLERQPPLRWLRFRFLGLFLFAGLLSSCVFSSVPCSQPTAPKNANRLSASWFSRIRISNCAGLSDDTICTAVCRKSSSSGWGDSSHVVT